MAKVFIKKKCQDLSEKLEFDSEASMFCVYPEDDNALRDFICLFENACEDEKIKNLFSGVELE